jgi:hypothetical protein
MWSPLPFVGGEFGIFFAVAVELQVVASPIAGFVDEIEQGFGVSVFEGGFTFAQVLPHMDEVPKLIPIWGEWVVLTLEEVVIFLCDMGGGCVEHWSDERFLESGHVILP